MLVKLGFSLIDADRIVHELLETEPVKKELCEAFGEEIFDSKGKLDRERLSEIVFTDAEKLSRLNKLIHPRVLALAEEMLEQYKSRAETAGIVLDMPLLLEVV